MTAIFTTMHGWCPLKAVAGWPRVRICIGGTFDPFHLGHEALLTAVQAEHVFVGVTVDAMASRPDREVASFEERREHILKVLPHATVRPLRDGVGPAVSGDYDAIVVSPETVLGAEVINQKRMAERKPPLDIIEVPHVLAKDLKPISGTRIHAGTIDRDGNRLTPIRVRVGSENPVKIRGVEAAFTRLTGCEVLVEGAGVTSGVPEQPTEVETILGAEQRALSAWGDCDYSVGVEAGLQRDEQGLWFDVQAAVVYDGDTLTRGYGPAFQYPDFVSQRALRGEMISDIVGPLAGDADIGGTTGAIGFLTNGAYQRDEFTAQAVMMALVPRVRRDLYLRRQ